MASSPRPAPRAANQRPDWLDRLQIESMMQRFLIPPKVRDLPRDHAWWRSVPEVREALMDAQLAGLGIGVLRAGPEAGRNAADTGKFVGRLFDPVDRKYSPPGQAAWDQLIGATKGAIDYTASRWSHPGRLLHDVGAAANQANNALNPNASPSASLNEDLHRQLETGVNRGKLVVNAGMLAASALGGLDDAALAPELTDAMKYKMLGYSPKISAHLASPYKGMGHHEYFPRRYTIPEDFKGIPVPQDWVGKKLPRSVSDSPFNVVKPPGITYGDMYDLHARLDKDFHGAKLPGGGGWRAADHALDPYTGLERLWYGTPTAVKATAAGTLGAAAAGDLAYGYLNGLPKK